MKSFLIIQTAFIGDVILATPLIEKLRQFYPEAKIDILIRKGNEGLLKGHPKIDNVLIWNKKANKFFNLIKILKIIRKKKYSHVINLQRFLATGMLTTLSGAGEKIGFDKNPLSFLFNKRLKHKLHIQEANPHEVTRNLELISHLTDKSFIKPRLYPSDADYKKISIYTDEPYICIAPASVWFTKQFPAEKWIEFLNSFPKKMRVFLIGSYADSVTAMQIISNTTNKNISLKNLCGALTLLESAALLESSAMNYVNDSAPLHMCSAMNAPTTAIFCSTLPSFGFGPLADNSTIIETAEKLHCRPCNNHGLASCPEKHFKCAFSIDVKNLTNWISQ